MNNNSLFGLIFRNKKLAIVTVCSGIIYSFAEVLATLGISKAIDYITQANGILQTEFIRSLLLLIVLYIVSVVCNWINSAFSIKIAFNTAKSLRKQLFTKLGYLPLSYLDSSSHGDILSRFVNDIDSISDALTLCLNTMISGLATVISVLIVMFILDFRIALVILLLTPLTILVARIVTRASQKTFTQQQNNLGEFTGYVNEIVGNQKVVKALGFEDTTVSTLTAITSGLKTIGIKAHFAAAMVNPSTRIVDHISYIAVGVVGGFLAISSSLSLGTISAFLIFSGQFSKPFNEISGIISQIQVAIAAYGRVSKILVEQEELPDNISASIVEHSLGKVEFNEVGFSYNKRNSLIVDLSFKASPGDLIAIVGPTGAGKTTIVNLLMRFYEINKGAIFLDENNITEITRKSLRKSFGMVLQETWLFKGTVRDNIAYSQPGATDEEIIAAAKAGYAHDFIMSLPEGYNTIIAEGAGNLSNGQKQLLTIARVILTNPSLLILDEATSAIDTLTEQRVQKAFLKLMDGRTSFVIAHRLSTIVKADTILVLDKGKIIETGTHKELLAKKCFYYELYNSQFK